MRGLIRTSALLLVLGAAVCQGQAAPVFSTSGHLVLRDGRPFFWLGDTGWLLMRLDPEQVRFYLDDRAAKRFNVIQMMAIRTDHIRTSPTYQAPVANYAGERPFRQLDPVVLNEAYWRHIDFIIDAAAERNLTVAQATMWGRDADRLFPEPLKNNRQYGELLGRRYRDRDNVIWLVTGEYEKIRDDWRQDSHISDEQRTILRAIALGLEAGHGARHLMTIHPIYASSNDFHNDAWLDFNMQQTWGHANADVVRIRSDYEKTPVRPVLNGEPGYENRPEAPTSSAWKCRYEGYWSVFTGGFGFTYGAERIWQFRLEWKDALQDEGAGDMQHLRTLMESRPLDSRIPAAQMVVEGAGSMGGEAPSYCTATRASDGSYAMVYATMGKPFTLDLTSLAGERLNAWWYSPRDGLCYGASSTASHRPFAVIEAETRRAFTPPTVGLNQDWVLVLDDAERRFPPPGQPASGAR